MYGFHDTKLSQYVKNAFHALAIDEHREAYAPTLWTDIEPGRNVKQLWFAGCHCDIGGGYESHALADVTLRWMQECCQLDGNGLEFSAARRSAERRRPWAGAPRELVREVSGRRLREAT